MRKGFSQMNNGKYHSEDYKRKQNEKIDRNFGPVENHKKVCERCNQEYVFVGRKKTKQYEQSRYCSRSCSNNRQDWWKENATKYVTIAFHHWERKCVICSFDKIVEVHHLDENRNNNDPKNLVPLCPNHHQMVHSRWKCEIIEQINESVQNKWGQQRAAGFPCTETV